MFHFVKKKNTWTKKIPTLNDTFQHPKEKLRNSFFMLWTRTKLNIDDTATIWTP
jgi:hypothetical protein